MKKKVAIIFGILLISGLSITLTTSCDKDTFCYLDVNVVAPVLDSAGKAIEGTSHTPDSCWVVINQTGGTVSDTQRLDQTGLHSYTFSAPAIFKIRARIHSIDTVNTKTCYYYEGTKAIRLKEGERVTATVKIEGGVPYNAYERVEDGAVNYSRYDFTDIRIYPK